MRYVARAEDHALPIDIVPFTPDLVPAVQAFNKRLLGTGWGWYEDPVPDWIPKKEGQRVWREYWLAVEDGKEVRAAYALKPQEWRIRGEIKMVADWQGPVSEGMVDRKYSMLVLRLLRDMLKKRPLLYSWGHGGNDAALPTLVRSVGGWLLYDTPVCLYVLRPNRFLRLNKFLRGDDARRGQIMDFAAASGLGWAGLKALHAALSLRGLPRPRRTKATPHVVDTFGEWADDLWLRVRDRSTVIAVRDRECMNLMVPTTGWPHGIKVQVKRGDTTIGWAVVLDNQLKDDPRFGDMHMGSVVDVLAAPEDARDVVAAAHEVLADRGVDMVLSNQSHPVWADAFAAAGYAVVPNKRLLAASPELWKAIEPFEELRHGLHLTNMDGHGPHAL